MATNSFLLSHSSTQPSACLLALIGPDSPLDRLWSDVLDKYLYHCSGRGEGEGEDNEQLRKTVSVVLCCVV
jgi:hypothetical protein